MSELFHIISDGSCDIDLQKAEELNIDIVPFYVSFDGENYLKEGKEIDVRQFYQKMVDNPKVYPKTSMPSVQDYADLFMKYAEENIPVLCICITTKFSGSMQSALNAKELVLEKYENAQIEVMDAMMNTVLQGLYVKEACKLRDRGYDLQGAAKRLGEIRGSGRIFFTVGNLEYLQHGGRIGKVAGLCGSLLGIRPMITLKEGEIFPSGMGRSRKSTIEKCACLLYTHLKENQLDLKDYSIVVGYGYNKQDGIDLIQALKNKFLSEGIEIEEPECCQIGATIGVHTGPYPIGVAIVEKSI